MFIKNKLNNFTLNGGRTKENNKTEKSLLLLSSGGSGLLCGLGDFASSSLGFVDSLDHTHSHGLPHVTNGESSEWGVVSEGLNAKGLGWDELDDSGVSVLQSLGVVLNLKQQQ